MKTVRIRAAGDDVVVKMAARPSGGRRKICTEWMADSGVKKTLLSEDDWEFMKKHNPAAKLIRLQAAEV